MMELRKSGKDEVQENKYSAKKANKGPSYSKQKLILSNKSYNTRQECNVTVVYSKRISNNGKRFLTPFLNILNP
jgi:hypothetical protein